MTSGLRLRILSGLCMVSLFTGGAVAAPQEDVLKVKIQELEERLRRLEAQAQTPAEQPKSEDLQEFRRQLDILAAEVEKLRAGEEQIELPEERRRALGLAPSASATYEKRQGVSLAGYGEMLYENFDDRNESGAISDPASRFDFLRHIFYMGYRFNDRLVFNSEVEIEHANEAFVEFAYVDYLASDYLTLRGGMVLMPMGLVNEFHEPNVFLGARRTETESRIIPTTWRENGFGALGSAGIFNYRAYVVNGFKGAGFTAGGFRGGRQKGIVAAAADFGVVGRLDIVPTPGVFFGGSLYRGGVDQNAFQLNGQKLDVTSTIGEVHGQAQFRGLDLRGLYARSNLDNAGEFNLARGLSGQNALAETMEGGYLQFGYNVLSQVDERFQLTPYYRFERVDTQETMPTGFTRNAAQDGTFHTFGLEFRPVYGIVVKSDYQWVRNQARTGRNQLNILLGYAF